MVIVRACAQAIGNAAGNQAFAGAGRADQQQVFTRQHGEQRRFQGVFTLNQAVVELDQQGFDFFLHRESAW